VRFFAQVAIVPLWLAGVVFAQTTGRVAGRVSDETGAALPGVTVELRADGDPTAASGATAVTSASGDYAFEAVAPGRYQVTFSLINFA